MRWLRLNVKLLFFFFFKREGIGTSATLSGGAYSPKWVAEKEGISQKMGREIMFVLLLIRSPLIENMTFTPPCFFFFFSFFLIFLSYSGEIAQIYTF